MKTKIFTALVVLVTIFSVDNSSAQSKRDLRRAERAARDSQYVAAVTMAVQEMSFSFSADYLSSGSAQRVPLTRGYRTVNVSPDFLNVKLPYFTTSRAISVTPLVLDFTAADFQYTVANQRGMLIVSIKATNVNNNQSSRKSQSGAFSLQFTIAPASGATSLLVTPNFTAPITYNGTLILD